MLLLDHDGRGRLEGSAAHPTRTLTSVEIDLPGGGVKATKPSVYDW